MNAKRTYLDSLNTGRRRRQHAALDELSQTLSELENQVQSRLARPQTGKSEPRVPAERRYAQPYHDDDPAPRRAARPFAAQSTPDDLSTLRDELRHELSSGLRREFNALKDQLSDLLSSAQPGNAAQDLLPELERLSHAVQKIANRDNSDAATMLKSEIDELKHVINDAARTEASPLAEQRWDDLDRRWDAIEGHMRDGFGLGRQQEAAIEGLAKRIETIGEALGQMPDSVTLRSLDEKVRALAGALDRIAGNQTPIAQSALAVLEERLDEISRAVAASASTARAATFDPAPLERIEARISSLASQVSELAGSATNSDIGNQIRQLSERMDHIADQTALPDAAFDRINDQLLHIVDRLDRTQAPVDTEVLVQGLGERMDALAQSIEQSHSDVSAQSRALFEDLERRLEHFAHRLETTDAGESSPAVLNTIQARLDELFEKVGSSDSITDNETSLLTAIDQRFHDLAAQMRVAPDALGTSDVDAFRTLETKLESVSAQLDASSRQPMAVDADMITTLQAQIADLNARMTDQGTGLPGMELLAPRLEQIENLIAGNRVELVEAARQAAEEAVRSSAPNDNARFDAASALGEDIKVLEQLSRRSEERNSRTFEAVHETLLKIVDRLVFLEEDRTAPMAGLHNRREAPSEQAKIHVSTPPALDSHDEHLAGMQEQPLPIETAPVAAPKRTPSEAAAEAALAALARQEEQDQTDTSASGRSLFGGIARALKGRKTEKIEPEDPQLETPEPKVVDDIAEIDRPLEPGSGAPDLSAIVDRVRKERETTAPTSDPESAKADFIAAARRAAQAAAAEADANRPDGDAAQQSTAGGLSGFIKARRKTLLVGASVAIIALAGLQLGKSLLGGDAPATPEVAMEAEGDGDAVAEAEAVVEVSPVDTSEARTIPVRVIDAPSDTVATSPDQGTALVTALTEEPSAPATMTEIPAEPETLETGAFSVEIGPTALREAVSSGDPKAFFEVGARLAEGRGTPANAAKAAIWYERAAEAGLASAQYRIANSYEKGIGVERDIAKAKMWYQLSAGQGNASAMHNLAVLFAMGADGTADNESAVRWFLEAAERGVKDSQFNLGILAAKGLGMPQDLVESYKWFAVAGKDGDKGAVSKRDEIAKALRPEQLDRARAEADLWKPRLIDPAANSVIIPDSWRDQQDVTASVDMTKVITNIQVILSKLGYDAGTPDGIIGEKTKSAIAAFQKKNGMTPTGAVDEELVRTLLAKR